MLSRLRVGSWGEWSWPALNTRALRTRPQAESFSLCKLSVLTSFSGTSSVLLSLPLTNLQWLPMTTELSTNFLHPTAVAWPPICLLCHFTRQFTPAPSSSQLGQPLAGRTPPSLCLMIMIAHTRSALTLCWVLCFPYPRPTR